MHIDNAHVLSNAQTQISELPLAEWQSTSSSSVSKGGCLSFFLFVLPEFINKIKKCSVKYKQRNHTL